MASTFVVNKEKLDQTVFIEKNIPPLQESEVLFEVEKYYLSSSNITYAVTGNKLKYWDFFPQKDNYGAIPVWAYLRVIKSKNEKIKVGDLYFGLSPMGNHFKVEPGNYAPHGFSDVAQHRSKLLAPYNFYTKIFPEHYKSTEDKDYSLMTRITFPTSFLIKSFLERNLFFGAKQIIITSASSKTALGVAFLLKKYKDKWNTKIIGITSNDNIAFVEASELYDEVISYSNIKVAVPKRDSVILDFNGNADLLSTLHEMLQASLKHISLIGATNWKANKSFKNIPNCISFAAGEQYQKLVMELGIEKAMQLLMTEMNEFSTSIQNYVMLSYLNIIDLPAFYQKLLSGQTDPKFGYFVQNELKLER
jgi:hypothetical protein